MHPKFDLTGVQTQDLYHDSTFHVTETPVAYHSGISDDIYMIKIHLNQ